MSFLISVRKDLCDQLTEVCTCVIWVEYNSIFVPFEPQVTKCSQENEIWLSVHHLRLNLLN